MTVDKSCESKLWEVLAKGHLVDLSQFHRAGFFEEVPLFSRAADIAFLSEYPDDRADAILLDFALKFFKSVVSYEEHRTAYFAAITAWSFSEPDPLVPNLFVWSGPIQRLEKRLVLKEATTPFGKDITRLVSRIGARKRFEVREDTSAMPEMSRVFISLTERPYRSFVTLDRFRKAETTAI